jgi:hypothetical protein
MGLPKSEVNPSYNYTYPSERDYRDESKSTLLVAQMTDTAKSGKDYGITDPEKTKPVEAGDTGGE